MGGMETTADWERLAERVRARRLALDMKQSDIPNVGKATLSQIENAKADSYKDFTLAALERALRWQHGSVQAVLNGDDPVELDTPAPTQSPADFMAESRARFDQATDVLSEVSSVALQTAALVRANRAQLVLIAEHLGVPVVPEPSVVE